MTLLQLWESDATFQVHSSPQHPGCWNVKGIVLYPTYVLAMTLAICEDRGAAEFIAAAFTEKGIGRGSRLREQPMGRS